MALNVYMTFFKKATASMLQSYEKYYFALCYGLPITLGLIFLFMDVFANYGIYGPATVSQIA
jgi:hypothetical protein